MGILGIDRATDLKNFIIMANESSLIAFYLYLSHTGLSIL